MNHNNINKPKLIVLDLDGTTLNSNNIIPKNLEEMLINLVSTKTCRIVLASGRSISSMKIFSKNLGLEAPVITLNGGSIIDPISNKIYYEKNLSPEIYSESLIFLKKFKIDIVVFTSVGVYAEKNSKITEILKEHADSKVELVSNLDTILAPVKILIYLDNESANTDFRNFTSSFDIDIIDSGFSFIEMVPRGVNKGSALQIVSQMLEINQDSIIAFGDNKNDIEMLQLAGTGVVMGNAPDHVKIKADILADTNDNDGVLKVLNKIFNRSKQEILS